MGADRQRELIHAARQYMRRGFAPVPIYAGRKDPCLKNWLQLRLRSADVQQAFRTAGNLGLILGCASRDLVDVDLDCAEARELADEYLPPTEGITGRRSSPRSHYWYLCAGVQTTRHRDPVTRASIVELRSTGSQTLVGPSIHPSGEPYDFLQGEPALVDLPVIRQAVASLAAEVIRLRHGTLPQPPPKAPQLPTIPLTTDRAALLRRASAYLGAMPPAISGKGGHNATYAAATALVHGFRLPAKEAIDLLRREYNPRCKPPWSEKELVHKITEAATKPHSLNPGWLI